MKRKNTAKKALAPALLGAVCSLVALTSVSYAWFTMGDTANVGNIDVNVQAADGMQISADAVSWKSNLPLEALEKEAGNLLPVEEQAAVEDDPLTPEINEAKEAVEATELAPVSTTGAYSQGKQVMYHGKLENDEVSAKLETEGSVAENYLAFDLFVKLDSDSSFNLAAGSYVLGNGEIETELAARVSFANLGTVAMENYTQVAAKGLGTLFDGKAVIWEPNADKHIEAVNKDFTDGVVDASYDGISGLTGAADAEGYQDPTYEEVKAGTDEKPYLVQTLYGNDGKLTEDNEKFLFNLAAGVSKVRVYIWIEGEDVDCLNDIAEGSISVGLNFKKADPVLTGVEATETLELTAPADQDDPATDGVDESVAVTGELAYALNNGIELPEGATAVWTIPAEEQQYATVTEEGVVTPVAAGTATATITVTVGNKVFTDTCAITVNAPAASE